MLCVMQVVSVSRAFLVRFGIDNLLGLIMVEGGMVHLTQVSTQHAETVYLSYHIVHFTVELMYVGRPVSG